MSTNKTVVVDKTQETSEASAMVKFCPICGDKMHKEAMYDALWWVCDDPDCGYIELIEQVS